MSLDIGSARNWIARWGAVLAVATLAACGGGGGGSASGDGTLRVALTDAPSCGYDNVYVTVEKVRVHTAADAADAEGGWSEIVLAPARRIDLLALTNGVLEELGSTALPAGDYSQVRLVLASNSTADPFANAVKVTDGALVALDTPSAQQSGLKLQAHFTVEPGQLTDLVLDFDACKSVVKAGNSGKYNLKPVISVVPRLTTALQGYVAIDPALGATTVSAQQGGVVVRSTVPDATGKFTLAYLPAGAYDIVVVSEGRATLVVTGVPVATGSTVLNGTATAWLAPASEMSEVSGTTSVGSGTSTVVVTDASVSATQALTGGPTVVIASMPVDAVLGTYSLRLPQAAPLKAAYSASGVTFTADAAVAGEYSLNATAPGRTAVQQAIDVSAGDLLADLVFAP
jgi:uncharacterized protein with GYD domain